jgi:hypothetical protein
MPKKCSENMKTKKVEKKNEKTEKKNEKTEKKNEKKPKYWRCTSGKNNECDHCGNTEGLNYQKWAIHFASCVCDGCAYRLR